MTRQLAIEKALTNANTPIAYIRLRGRWLKKFGFEPGERVDVRLLEPGTIELKAATIQKSPALPIIPDTRL